MDQEWTMLANAAASALVFVCSAVFAVTYHRKAPWRSTPIGRHLMAFSVAIGLLGMHTALVTWFPDGVFALAMRMFRTLLLLVMAGLLLQRTCMVVRAQREDDDASGHDRTGVPDD